MVGPAGVEAATPSLEGWNARRLPPIVPGNDDHRQRDERNTEVCPRAAFFCNEGYCVSLSHCG